MSNKIITARFPQDTETVAKLFRDYAKWLNVDLGFQGFEEELASLPGKYAEPRGSVLLLPGKDDGPAIGCIAMRPLTDERCEMKRLYLQQSARGQGHGKLLVQAILDRAKQAGYRQMVLDTLDDMQDALRLYERMGFSKIPPYYDNPMPNAVYLGRDL